MRDAVMLTGMVIKASDVGEADRRVVLLTRERGKIAAFAKGAKRQGSRLIAATNPFAFGTFKLYEGSSSYHLSEANITQFFEPLRGDFEKAYVGMYFLEICDFLARENNDEKELLRLLYQSLRALTAPGLSKELVRYVFELRAIVVNGEFPGVPEDMRLSDTATYAVSYIASAKLEKLYTFSLSPQALLEVKAVADRLRRRFLGGPFKSQELVDGQERF